MLRFFLLFLTTALVAAAGEVSITLPPEVASLKTGPNLEVAQANCTLCHSADYLRTQPPMPRKFWEAAVKKMREKYAAPIAEENVPKLVEYLVQSYGLAEK